MRIYFTLKMALNALRHNVMRAALTTLGIIIGVAAVITMMEIGKGAISSHTARNGKHRRQHGRSPAGVHQRCGRGHRFRIEDDIDSAGCGRNPERMSRQSIGWRLSFAPASR